MFQTFIHFNIPVENLKYVIIINRRSSRLVRMEKAQITWHLSGVSWNFFQLLNNIRVRRIEERRIKVHNGRIK